MALYLNGLGTIAPAPARPDAAPPRPGPPAGNRLSCVEPGYAAFIDPRLSRRMSRVVKMGIAAAQLALQDAGLSTIDGVIAGTGWGCLADTVTFLEKMVGNNEEMLSPSAFIHSTHNTIAAQIAYHLQCRGYNSTYVHRNISFESTLIDATLLLQEQPGTALLVGGIDELTPTSFDILSRLGTYKAGAAEDADLYADGRPGTWAGEGAAFFVVSDAAGPAAYARLLDVKTLSFTTPEAAVAAAHKALRAHGLAGPDVLIAGYNGDPANDTAVAAFERGLGGPAPARRFKHLCGEYPTASAFALSMAAALLGPDREQPAAPKEVKSVLVYNRFQQAHQSLMLLGAC